MFKFDYKWMQVAYREATKAEKRSEIPIGAVLVNLKNNRILSKSCNKIITKSNPLAHAEMEVIIQACKILKTKFLYNTALYVTLEPCAMCAAAISESRIEKVFFGAFDEKKGAIENGVRLFKQPAYHKPDVYGGMLENECSQLLKIFFTKVRKNKK